MIGIDYNKSLEDGKRIMDDLSERYKTCGRCIHAEEADNIVGSTCYLCRRNSTDNRIDWFEENR